MAIARDLLKTQSESHPGNRQSNRHKPEIRSQPRQSTVLRTLQILAKDEKLFVHFDIFDYLKTRIISRMRADVISQLLRVELNTHAWALGRIDKHLVSDYTARAIRSLHDGYEVLSTKHKHVILASVGPDASELLQNALRLKKAVSLLRF